VRLDTGRTDTIVFTPRSTAEPVAVDDDEFEETVAKLARHARPPARPQEAARRLFDVEARSGSYTYETPSRRITPHEPGEHLEGESPAAEVELTRAYLRWCERTGRPGDCLRLLTESPTVNGDGRFALAMALAKSAVLDEMLEAFKDMADPHAMVAAVLWTWTTYMVLLSIPDVTVSKGIAAVMTATIISYVGVDTFWGLVVGFKRLMDEADRATTFNELREAGERYGKLMGRNAARAFALLAMAAIGNTAPGLAAKVPKLPGYAAASMMAEAQGGFRLSAVSEVQSVAVSAGGSMTLTLAPIAVASTAMGPGGGNPLTGSSPGRPAEKPVEVRPPVARHHARQVDQATMAKGTNSVIEPRVDINADVAAIRAGRAHIGRTPGGELSYSVNGRTYGAHANGTLYPMEGDGIHVLNRGAFQALGVYNKFGNTPRAAQILDNMKVGATERASALNVWKTYQ
jgi:hypothetical protein